VDVESALQTMWATKSTGHHGLVGLEMASSTTVKNLDVIFERDLSFNSHVKQISTTSCLHLRTFFFFLNQGSGLIGPASFEMPPFLLIRWEVLGRGCRTSTDCKALWQIWDFGLN